MIVTNRALFEKKKEESGNICFRKEAEEWNQAFPVGNGFLGAMVFGNVAKERIQVNEDSVWSGGFSNRVNPDAGRYLEKSENVYLKETFRKQRSWQNKVCMLQVLICGCTSR